MGRPGICTREQVKTALNSQATARDDDQVDRGIASAREDVEALLHVQNVEPWHGTRYFDWPNYQRARAYELWLDDSPLISLTSATAGGTAVTLLPEPVNSGPPYNLLVVDLAGATSLGSGLSHQRSIGVVGVWGLDRTLAPAGVLAEALETTTETDVDVTDVSRIGVGSLLYRDTEAMIVTAKDLLDTGQNLGANLASSDAARLVDLTSGAAFHAGETITIDAEEMLLTAIAGNNGIVRRAWNGSALAAHTTGADIYAPRRLTVERGAQGTTAITHLTATALQVWVPPPVVNALSVGEAMTHVLGEQAGWARTAGSGDNEQELAGKGLAKLREQAFSRYGRMRTGAI